jgi:ABC-type transport system involved in multi-copper enzyme maturation permease subunit
MAWLTGPIFDKELRVSSRRRRNYALRFFYLLLLMAFLTLFWLETVPRGAGSLNQVSRMAEAGKAMTSFIVWFQFIAAQLIAIIMLSNSISDEVYNRTLGLLMTTPINSFQIVVGKLLSKLLQVVLILAISLPILAIIRVFGGVPWLYVVSSLCITLTTVVFVGSISLFFSVFSRKAYTVIIVTILTLFAVFALLPWLSGFAYHLLTGDWPNPRLTRILFFPNPYAVITWNTAMMISPMGGAGFGGMAARFWPLHCGIMLAASGVVLFLAVCIVRKVALRQATGQGDLSSSKKSKGSDEEVGRASPPRRVVGPVVMWKELRTPVLGRRRLRMILGISLGVILLLVTYGMCLAFDAFDEGWTHIMYAAIYTGAGMLFTAILPATCITSEKESQSWPLLLATTLDDWEILFGKFAGVVRRCIPIWCLLFGHIVIFCLAGYIRPIAIVHTGMIAFWIVAFLSGTGLYFSARFRHTTTAVIANFALGGVLWVLGPIITGMIFGITRTSLDLFAWLMGSHPFVQVAIVIDGATNSSGDYHWPGMGSADAAESTIWLLVCTLAAASIGLLFAWRAKCRFRVAVF